MLLRFYVVIEPYFVFLAGRKANFIIYLFILIIMLLWLMLLLLG